MTVISRPMFHDLDFEPLRGLLCFGGGVCLVLGIVGLVIRSAVKGAKNPRRPAGYTGATVLSPPTAAPPPLPNVGVAPAQTRYKIVGVDRETKMDTVFRCYADSDHNARVKGELEGIIVTGVEREI